MTAEEFPEGERPVINADELGQGARPLPLGPARRHERQDADLDVAPRVAVLGRRGLRRALHAARRARGAGRLHAGRPRPAGHRGPGLQRAAHAALRRAKEPTKSTVKSQSAEAKKEVDGFNEIRFEDKAKQEEIYLHAQRNLDEVVLAQPLDQRRRRPVEHRRPRPDQQGQGAPRAHRRRLRDRDRRRRPDHALQGERAPHGARLPRHAHRDQRRSHHRRAAQRARRQRRDHHHRREAARSSSAPISSSRSPSEHKMIAERTTSSIRG